MQSFLEYKDIQFTYQTQAGHTLNHINFSVQEGEMITILGTSGSGKTTLIKLANKLLLPTSGAIYLKGQNIADIDTKQLRRRMGYVIQQAGLFPHMTVKENINVVARLSKEDIQEARLQELLSLTKLPADKDFQTRRPWQLSGGQQQRVGLARALYCDPELLLMDEPFGALDAITRYELQQEFLALQQETKTTVLFVTHDLREALMLGDRVMVLRDGAIQQLATPEELIQNPANDYVRLLLQIGRG
ncbi:MAG: ABC transporter ATP-binding protein [Oscillospiraceae bacterium]|nr:ABC transporter ATP-binding protein [Oscillospiraceae bacterium]